MKAFIKYILLFLLFFELGFQFFLVYSDKPDKERLYAAFIRDYDAKMGTYDAWLQKNYTLYGKEFLNAKDDFFNAHPELEPIKDKLDFFDPPKYENNILNVFAFCVISTMLTALLFGIFIRKRVVLMILVAIYFCISCCMLFIGSAMSNANYYF